MPHMARPKAIIHHASVSTLVHSNALRGGDMACVIVGPERREFRVNKKLLGASCSFFRDQLAPNPICLSEQKSAPVWLAHSASPKVICLLNESAAMFELFTVWLHRTDDFRRHLDDMINLVGDAPETTSQRFHWALVHLHIFAARLELPVLQDVAIDALQDLYLCCDWDCTPAFITFLFGQREAGETLRLRRWATAMVAWSLAGGTSPLREHNDPTAFQSLLDRYADFNAEYLAHTAKLKQGKLNPRIKNPQLRIPANKLRNDERQFGFRQCSFHTHRAAVGENKCPHSITPSSSSSNRASVANSDSYPVLVPFAIEVRPVMLKPATPLGKHNSNNTRRARSPCSSTFSVRHSQYEFPDHVPMPLRRKSRLLDVPQAA